MTSSTVGERDPVAEALLRAEDRQDLALVVGRVRAPERLLGDRRRPEVGVVEDRPVVAGRRRAHVGRSGSQTRSASHAPRGRRPNWRSSSSAIRTSWPIRSRSGRAARTGSYQPPPTISTWPRSTSAARRSRKSGRSARSQASSGPAVVEGEADAGMALEGLEHRQVGPVVRLGDDPAEVADRLVVVEGQGERDPPRHAGSLGGAGRAGAGPGRSVHSTALTLRRRLLRS